MMFRFVAALSSPPPPWESVVGMEVKMVDVMPLITVVAIAEVIVV